MLMLLLPIWLIAMPVATGSEAMIQATAETVYVATESALHDSIELAKLEVINSLRATAEHAVQAWEDDRSLVASWLSPTLVVPIVSLLGLIIPPVVNAYREKRRNRRKDFEAYRTAVDDITRSVPSRKTAIIELGRLGRKAEFVSWTTNYLVERLFDENDESVLSTLSEELIQLGRPVLQKLINKHRERYPIGSWSEDTRFGPGMIYDLYTYEPPDWLPMKPGSEGNNYHVDLEKLELQQRNFVHSRDTICGILQRARFGNLARPMRRLLRPWHPFGITWRHLFRYLCGLYWLRFARPGLLFRRRWLDQNGLGQLALPGAKIYGTNLSYANLMSSQLSSATISNVMFRSIDAGRIQLNDVDLQGVYFDDSYMPHSQLNGTKHFLTSFKQANMRHASLLGAEDLSTSDLTYADLEHARVRANITLAAMSLCQVKHADFSGSQIALDLFHTERAWEGANWWEADGLTREQQDAFASRYPNATSKVLFLQYWKPTEFGGYARRRRLARLYYRLHRLFTVVMALTSGVRAELDSEQSRPVD